MTRTQSFQNFIGTLEGHERGDDFNIPAYGFEFYTNGFPVKGDGAQPPPPIRGLPLRVTCPSGLYNAHPVNHVGL